ncbi:hypothetical protein QFZ73_005844 [Peribacillus sp. V2I11]|nr:hypothetical protein [Peribacillus sp. V2I11]
MGLLELSNYTNLLNHSSYYLYYLVISVVEEKDGTSSRTVAKDSSHNFYDNCYSFPVREVDGSNNKAELEFHFKRTDSFQSGKNVKNLCFTINK